MKIQLLRNATLVVEIAGQRILVDPMLGDAHSIMPFAFLRHAARRNPTVPLPPGADAALQGITLGIITHCRRGHADHLDGAGAAFLEQNKVPVYCSSGDESHLVARKIRTIALRAGEPRAFFGGTIQTTPAQHGHGAVGAMMGRGVGYMIVVPGEPSLYLSGDTVMTDEVRDVLATHRPDVAVVHAGGASMDVGRPILMTLAEIAEFVRLAPGLVVATHLEALNHCPATRADVAASLAAQGLLERVRIPRDGDTIDCSRE